MVVIEIPVADISHGIHNIINFAEMSCITNLELNFTLEKSMMTMKYDLKIFTSVSKLLDIFKLVWIATFDG